MERADKIISVLEKKLEVCDLVILMDKSWEDRFGKAFFSSSSLEKTDKHLAFFSTVDLSVMIKDQVYISVSENDLKTLIDLYRSYDCSDKLMYLTRSANYADIVNYVDTGVITEEEMFEALLA